MSLVASMPDLSSHRAEQTPQCWALRGLPAFPAVAAQLLKLLATDDFDIAKLVNLIRSDPMFASELLQTVNSARYAVRREVTSIQQAVMFLGRNTLRSFAIAVSLRLYVGKAIRQEALARVWRHSLATAAVCELLAQSCQEAGSDYKDTAYVAGLLHDVGCLGLMVLHPEEYARIVAHASETDTDLRDAERERLQLNHCEAGQMIARSWRFPVDIEAVALLHHDPLESGQFTLLELVKAGVLLADSLGWSPVPFATTPKASDVVAMLPDPVQQRLGISPEDMQVLIVERISAFDRNAAASALPGRTLVRG